MKKRDLLSLTDLSRREIDALLKRSMAIKKRWKKGHADYPLAGMSLGLVFDKPSTRTRVSFEVAMIQLGGHPIYLDPGTTQIKRGEPIADSARVLSRYLDGVVIRTFEQATVEEWARWSSAPVINGLTDLLHPCQVFCDLLTIVEKLGGYKGMKVAYVGDGNNMANTWIQAASLLDFPLSLACPEGYQPNPKILAQARQHSKGRTEMIPDPYQAVEGADVVYTDVWASMGQEKESKERKKRFKGFQVNSELLSKARKGALVMHCLPAHAGEEISAEVLEGPQSVVFDQAENRLHGQKAILEWLLKDIHR
ncbi:MAG: ornithine carbamoyltransferase [Thermodesulfobacteriota bacterium]|nr:ornithine carbamoyltransferase [Thermodesulfobacteriota bacterium]